MTSPLHRDENGIWRMDYEDMDRKIKKNHIHAAVFCSPHDPLRPCLDPGRNWKRLWRSTAAMTSLSSQDEIWSDLTLPGHKHIPTQSTSEDAPQPDHCNVCTFQNL